MYYVFHRDVENSLAWNMNKFEDKHEANALEYYADVWHDHGSHNTLFLTDLPESGRISGSLHLDWPDTDCKAKSFS